MEAVKRIMKGFDGRPGKDVSGGVRVVVECVGMGIGMMQSGENGGDDAESDDSEEGVLREVKEVEKMVARERMQKQSAVAISTTRTDAASTTTHSDNHNQSVNKETDAAEITQTTTTTASESFKSMIPSGPIDKVVMLDRPTLTSPPSSGPNSIYSFLSPSALLAGFMTNVLMLTPPTKLIAERLKVPLVLLNEGMLDRVDLDKFL
jgi:hypothetical protein